MKWQLLIATLLGCIAAQPSHAADQDQDKYPRWAWPLIEANKPGQYTFKTEKRTEGTNTVNVCMYRVPSYLPTGGQWKSRFGEGPEFCEEKLIADLSNRVFHVDFDQIGPGVEGADAVAGAQFIFDCTGGNGWYSPCNSIFYIELSRDRKNYKKPNPDFGKIIRYQTKTIEALEKLITERQVTYFESYKAATSLALIGDFETRYSNNDPDNLIAKLEPLKLQLETKKYQDRFAAAKSSSELQSFISEYESKDPDRLIPEAKKRLAAVQKVEQAEQERRKREQAIEQKQGKLLGLEDRIANCTRMTAQANRAIAREREIAAVSGYVNTSVMRQAGEYIVTCRSIIADSYAEYRKTGGTKSLSDMK